MQNILLGLHLERLLQLMLQHVNPQFCSYKKDRLDVHVRQRL